jgi:hypothetical protein
MHPRLFGCRPGGQASRKPIEEAIPETGTISLCEDYFSSNWENNHGTKIFQESIGQGRARDEKAQGRNVEERPVRSQGQEPQAGDRHRSFRGEGGRKEGPEEGLEEEKDRQKAKGEAIAAQY